MARGPEVAGGPASCEDEGALLEVSASVMESEGERGVEGAASRSRARSSRSSLGVTALWRAVWCNERCYKAELEAVRTAIGAAVSRLGGHLKCFKKAKRFEVAAPRMQPKPYVLITDGREARPCVDTLMDGGDIFPPALVVVLCQEGRHAARLFHWAQGLPQAGFHVPVVVIQDVAGLDGAFAEAAPALPTTATGPARLPDASDALTFNMDVEANESCAASSTAGTELVCTAQLSATTSQAGVELVASAAPKTHRVVSGAISWPIHIQPTPGAKIPLRPDTSPSPACSDGPSLFEKLSDEVTPEIMRIIEAAVPLHTNAADVAKMLLQVAPDMYQE